ncbi:MAG: thiopeptide-type bacteriocin biosynthesis protein [Rikenella sp.]|nr:thiopeptide-type bacteriocin biosynthesis protein [Rikenella sp.]
MQIIRHYIPGSEWLYFKLYTGYKSADTILLKYLQPLLFQLVESSQIQEYFFIRYSDPHFHIRLRLHIIEPHNYSTIFEQIHQTLSICLENGLLWNIMCDTYHREIERYGQQDMALSESVFCIDSKYLLTLLDAIHQTSDAEQVRWLSSFRLIDDLLEAGRYTLDDKCRLLERSSTTFRSEFQCEKQPYSGQLNDKYRQWRHQIENIITHQSASLARDSLYAARKQELYTLLASWNNTKREWEIPKDQLMSSYLHMTMNRWFRSKNRLCELVVYHCLDKYYKSVKARNLSIIE